MRKNRNLFKTFLILMQILGILPEEKDVVVAYYNEISTQLGEDDNE